MRIDHTRTDTAKGRTRTRRDLRRHKSAMQFLAIAFPADLSAFVSDGAR